MNKITGMLTQCLVKTSMWYITENLYNFIHNLFISRDKWTMVNSIAYFRCYYKLFYLPIYPLATCRVEVISLLHPFLSLVSVIIFVLCLIFSITLVSFRSCLIVSFLTSSIPVILCTALSLLLFSLLSSLQTHIIDRHT